MMDHYRNFMVRDINTFSNISDDDKKRLIHASRNKGSKSVIFTPKMVNRYMYYTLYVVVCFKKKRRNIMIQIGYICLFLPKKKMDLFIKQVL